MTKISYEPSGFRFLFDGHAGAAPFGEDLVCASASTLAGTLAAALDCYGIENIIVKSDGRVDIQARPTRKQEKICRTVYETIASGAELLAAKDTEHVRFTIL